MEVITTLRRKAREQQKTVLLPEYDDPRVQEAARLIEEQGIADAVLLSPDKINPDDKARYIEEYFQIHKAKELEKSEVERLFDDPLYIAAMMTKEGKADGYVAGATHTTPDVARSAIRCLGVDEDLTIASSCFIMVVPDSVYGEHGTFIFADCGIVPEPNSRQLACIALASAQLGHKVLGLVPRVALLSYSTRGSAKGKSIEKIREALNIIKERDPTLLVDGEMQVDAALVPEVAEIKYPDSPIQGRANVLVFPDLEAGNIGYKLVQRLANARAIGPLLLGLTKPCSDLSRGCSVDDIIDCVAVTAIRSQ